jgi:hypothetical protein
MRFVPLLFLCLCVTGSRNQGLTPVPGACENPAGDLNAPGVLLRPGSCESEITTVDPRAFGPHLWRAFHMIGANFPCPPTQRAYEACINFTYALPYMLPCSHCGYHLGQFIQTNIAMSGTVHDACMGARINERGEDESICLSPESFCRSQRNLTSFFVRAHNHVSNITHPCQARWTVDEALDEHKTLRGQFCPHNIVWGETQICRGWYCENEGGPPKHRCACDASGPKGTGGTYGEGHASMSSCYDST